MKLSIEVEVPENATLIEKQDALLYIINNEAWREIHHREEIHLETDLSNKCGSCRFFSQTRGCYGSCKMGRVYGQRARKACKAYERIDE